MKKQSNFQSTMAANTPHMPMPTGEQRADEEVKIKRQELAGKADKQKEADDAAEKLAEEQDKQLIRDLLADCDVLWLQEFCIGRPYRLDPPVRIPSSTGPQFVFEIPGYHRFY